MTDILPGTQGVVKRHKRAILLVKLCDWWKHSLLPRVVRVRTGILLCCRYSAEHCRGLIYIFSQHSSCFLIFHLFYSLLRQKWGNWWCLTVPQIKTSASEIQIQVSRTLRTVLLSLMIGWVEDSFAGISFWFSCSVIAIGSEKAQR